MNCVGKANRAKVGQINCQFTIVMSLDCLRKIKQCGTEQNVAHVKKAWIYKTVVVSTK